MALVLADNKTKLRLQLRRCRLLKPS